MVVAKSRRLSISAPATNIRVMPNMVMPGTDTYEHGVRRASGFVQIVLAHRLDVLSDYDKWRFLNVRQRCHASAVSWEKIVHL
jgi:hypothetical protein